MAHSQTFSELLTKGPPAPAGKGEKIRKKKTGMGKPIVPDREIAYQLLLWKNQTIT